MPRPRKFPKLELSYFDSLNWSDTYSALVALGTQFIFKITSPEISTATLFFYLDVYTPMEQSPERVQNTTSLRLSGHGLIVAQDQEGLDYWAKLLRAAIGARTKPTYHADQESAASGKKALDVMWSYERTREEEEAGDTEKSFVRAVSVKSLPEFLKQFKAEAIKEVKNTKIRYLVERSPEAIVMMIPISDLTKAFKKFENWFKIMSTASKETHRFDWERETEDEDEDLENLKGPSDEDLAAIEQEEENGKTPRGKQSGGAVEMSHAKYRGRLMKETFWPGFSGGWVWFTNINYRPEFDRAIDDVLHRFIPPSDYDIDPVDMVITFYSKKAFNLFIAKAEDLGIEGYNAATYDEDFDEFEIENQGLKESYPISGYDIRGEGIKNLNEDPMSFGASVFEDDGEGAGTITNHDLTVWSKKDAETLLSYSDGAKSAIENIARAILGGIEDGENEPQTVTLDWFKLSSRDSNEDARAYVKQAIEELEQYREWLEENPDIKGAGSEDEIQNLIAKLNATRARKLLVEDPLK
jgi:hypothetical protein